jgi:hypothetical protein
MAKGRRDRAAESRRGDRGGWLRAAAAPRRRFLDADEHYAETSVVSGPGMAADTSGRGRRTRPNHRPPDGQMMLPAPEPSVLFPGSFNLMQEGA